MSRRGRGLRGFDLQGYLDDRIGIKHTAEGGGGREIVADCPFCGGADKLWSNTVTGFWICYKCSESGDAVALVAQIDGLTRRAAWQWIEAEVAEGPSRTIDQLADLRDRDLAPKVDAPAGPARDLVPLPEDFVPVWDPADRTWHIPKYLEKRGIRARTAALFGLGYCESGLYADRLIMPVRMNGQLVTFQARSMSGQIPKYTAPATGKEGSLYGYDQAALATTVVIVEGPTDVLSVVQAGFPAIGLTGKVVSTGQVNAIRRARFDQLIVMLDPDAAGYDGLVAQAIAGAAGEVLLTRLPKGFDPGSAPRALIEAAIARARRPSLIDTMIPKDDWSWDLVSRGWRWPDGAFIADP